MCFVLDKKEKQQQQQQQNQTLKSLPEPARKPGTS